MAIGASAVWEVRTTGTGTGGGGFVTGVGSIDYSQQDLPEVSYDGATNVLAAAGAGSTLTCAARPFIAADVGNVINVTGGANLTTGRYQISSVVAGTATLDRAVSTGVCANGTGKLGGAMIALNTTLGAAVAGNTIYIKGTSFTIVAGISTALNGTVAAPTKIIGYGTTRGDNTQAVITAAAGIVDMFTITTGKWVVRNLKIDGASQADSCFYNSGGAVTYDNCWAYRFESQGFYLSANQSLCQDCYASGGTGSGATPYGGFVSAESTSFINCVVASTSGNGFYIQVAPTEITGCLATGISSTGSDGHGVSIEANGDARITHCTLNNVGGSGVSMKGSGVGGGTAVRNCLISNAAAYGIEHQTLALTDSDVGRRFRNNAFYACSSGTAGSVAPTNSISLTADPYEDATALDFRLNNTTGGGASCREAATPGTFTVLSNTIGYADVGAVQASVASGSGSDGASMRSLWREWTNERDTTVIPDDTVDLYIQSGLEALNRRIRYNWTDSTSGVTLVAGTQEYSLPDDCIEILFVELDGKRLKKGDLEEWLRRGVEWRSGTKTGIPEEWAHYADKIVFYPAPNTAAVTNDSTPTIRYVRTPRSFTSYGPELLATQDHRVPVYFGVAEYAGTPTAAMGLDKGAVWLNRFNEEVQRIGDFYLKRGTMR